MGMGKRKRFHGQDHALATGGENIREERWYARTGTVFSVGFFSFSVVVAVSLIAFTLVFFFSEVHGSSMMNNFNRDCPNEYCIENGVNFNTDGAIVNRHARPKRGDIIIVNDPREGRSGLFIKRMIALGGDYIYFNKRQFGLDNDGHQITVGYGLIHYFVIEVNGIEIDESYLDSYWGMNVVYGYIWNWMRPDRLEHQRGPFGQHIRYTPERDRYEIHVPPRHMFYMGDNRGGSGITAHYRMRSLDGTRLGPQPMSDFVGVVVDQVTDNRSLPAWVWNRFIWFVSFRWIQI